MGRRKVEKYTFDNRIDPLTRVTNILTILECTTAIKGLPLVLKKAQSDNISYIDFLDLVFEQEMISRESARGERWTKQAQFPRINRLNQYDFNYPEFIEKEKVLALTDCEWIKKGGNVVFFGASGVGKTHLSISLGLEAIKQGYETKFITVDMLTEKIMVAINKDNIAGGEHRKKLLAYMSNVKLLILDELAYSKITQEVSDFIFQLLMRRYDLQTSTILTSNKGFDTWGEFFNGNEVRAMAVLDRLIHQCVTINIKGESFRTTGTRQPALYQKKIVTKLNH
jgi:DNA replication protein DnaC